MQHYDVAAHIEKIRKIYTAKRDLMCDGLAGSILQFQRPAGGLFLWCALPAGTDMLEYTKRAVEKKVAVVPGVAFAVEQGDPINAVRLNFSTPTDEQLKAGVEILSMLSA
jgi:2-aminoadipate transaminase